MKHEIDPIIQAVAHEFEVAPRDVVGRTWASDPASHARQAAMFIYRRLYYRRGYAQNLIAYFGRNEGVVYHNLRVAQARMVDPKFKRLVDRALLRLQQ